jgi:glycosyltransferase involved in cell wall biosynthesis
MKILLLSAYDAPSHRRWRQGLVTELEEHSWTCLALPPRHFSWRVRGNSLTWSQDPILKQPYDLLIATSMTDLSALRGMVPELCAIPSILYFHENQFAYPENERQAYSLEPAVLNLYSAMAADLIVFNSQYNQDSFLSGVEKFLDKMPDQVPLGICNQLSDKACVVPVPLARDCFADGRKSEHLTLVWNHRWEYDKGQDRLVGICQELVRRKLEFRLHLLGQKFRDQPGEFADLVRLLQENNRLGVCGYVEDVSRYRRILGESHIVLSTAIQEFQGLAILEAMAAGCIAVVPDRLAYPEYVPARFRYFSEQPEVAALGYQLEIESAADKIVELASMIDNIESPSVAHLGWNMLAPKYRQLIEEAVG